MAKDVSEREEVGGLSISLLEKRRPNGRFFFVKNEQNPISLDLSKPPLTVNLIDEATFALVADGKDERYIASDIVGV